jgi:hypothetical protein
MVKFCELAFFTQMPLLAAAKQAHNRCFHGYFAVCCSGELSPFMCDTFYNVIREMR